MVFQAVYLFNDTIIENTRMDRPEAGDEEVLAAAGRANCHRSISRLPKSYDTSAGETGGSLSGRSWRSRSRSARAG